MDMDRVEQYGRSCAVTVSAFENAPNLFDAVFAIGASPPPPPPPPHFLSAFFGGYMPRKSTITHRGDVFLHPKTMCCKRIKNAVYWYLPFCFFVNFDSQNTIRLSKIYRKGLT